MTFEEIPFVLPLGLPEILKCVPHRYPFLLIDKVTELERHKRVVAIKNVSSSDPILQGHFPGMPVYPGVLYIEGMAQASCVLGHFSRPGFTSILLTEVSEARFRRPVMPGDVISYEVIAERFRSSFYWFSGTATVDGAMVASAKFSALLKY